MLSAGVLYSFAAAVFKASKSVTTKMAAVETDEYVASFATRLVTFFFVCIALLWFGNLVIPDELTFWVAFVLNTLIMTIVTILLARGFKLSDVSVVAPLMAFIPVFAMPPAIVVLGQIPTILAGAGVFLVTGGAYILNIHKRTDGLSEPIRAIFIDSGARATILGCAIGGIIPTLDKIGITYTTDLTWIALLHLASGALIAVIMFYVTDDVHEEVSGGWIALSAVGLSNVLLWIAQLRAYAHIDVVYVQAIKRAGILLVILVGSLYFNETHIRQRLVGAGVMIIGVVLIVIGS